MELSGDELFAKSKCLTTAAHITSFNSFWCLSKLGASTGSLKMGKVWNETVVLHRWERIHSCEGSTLETPAHVFQTFYCGKI